MYRQSYQRGMLTIFFSVGSKPLKIWDTRTQDGYITRFLDDDIKSMVLEIGGTNVSTTYMTCPKGNAVLGITMPFLVMIVKNLRKYFSFEITVLDETGTRRRFRVSNFQSTTQVLPLCTVMPIGLSEGWNQIQFNLAEFTRRAYRKQFVEVQKLKVNANIRLRRIYFAERIVPEDELPAEYKLFFPLKPKLKVKHYTRTEADTTVSVKTEMDEKKDIKSIKSSTIPISFSTRSIKRPSQEHVDEERPSQVLEVNEESLDRINALTDVVDAPLEPIEEYPDLAVAEVTAVQEIKEEVKVERVITAEDLIAEGEVVAGYEEDEENRTEELVIKNADAEEASVTDRD